MRLEAEPDILVVGEAAEGECAIALSRALRPDIALIDMEMEPMDGIQVSVALRRFAPEVAVVVLSIRDDQATQARARAAGAAAYVIKREAIQPLLDAIHAVRLAETRPCSGAPSERKEAPANNND
jgi:DNA-binding NarL/FixJ family response regulator